MTPFGIEIGNVSFKHPLGLANPLDYLSPAADAAWYAQVDDVRKKGGVASTYGNARTPEETVIGIFWGYDGVRGLGVPPRLYNQCVRAIALKLALTESENARLFAACNMAMADAGIVAWRSKYTYHVARPVIGVREADMGYGPASGAAPTTFNNLALPISAGGTVAWLQTAPNNPTLKQGDAGWAPLGAPQTNNPGTFSRTPPFPAYPSGHATFGAACFATVFEFLKAKLGSAAAANAETFEFGSDEYDGRNVGEDGSVRPLHKRTLTLAQAIHENAVSRVYLGVHWRIDAEEGVDLGSQVVALSKTKGVGPFSGLGGNGGAAVPAKKK